MKVYFVGSPKGKPKFGKNYKKIYRALESLGHKQLTDLTVKVEPEDHYKLSEDELVKHYNETMGYVRQADVVVVEASTQSMAMGYIVNQAVESLKPVVILHAHGKVPFFVSAIQDDKVQVVEYALESVKEVLESAIEYAQDQMETRFNFFISPRLSRYLDWVARKMRVPRAVHLRSLLEEDMKRNKVYQRSNQD